MYVDNMATWNTEDYLNHYHKKLIKQESEEKVLDSLKKLNKVHITAELLQQTEISKILKLLGKQGGTVGENASRLYSKWKQDVSKNSEKVSRSKSTNSHSSKVAKMDKCDIKVVTQSDRRENCKKKTSHDLNFKHDKSSQSATKPHNHQSTASFLTNGNNAHRSDSSSALHSSLESSLKVLPSKKAESSRTNSSSKSNGVFENESRSSSKQKNPAEVSKSTKHPDQKRESLTTQKTSRDQIATGNKNAVKRKSDSKLLNEKSKRNDDKKIPMKLSNSDKSSKKPKISTTESFTASEATFEDCLGFNDIVPSRKKKSSASSSKKLQVTSNGLDTRNNKKSVEVQKKKDADVKVRKSSSKTSKKRSLEKPMEKSTLQLKPAKVQEIDILSTLPEIQPNYRPLPHIDYSNPLSKRKSLHSEDFNIFKTSKRDRTAVYSGRRNNFSTDVSSLFDLCTRILIENIDCIGYTGGVPYFLLKPVLERCTPEQLYTLEDYNHYLLEETNELWERHCLRDYKKESREEGETWRDMYIRVFEEQQQKLKNITANISASMSKSNPVRQVKLAYVDSVAKPPRDVARRQLKHGTGLPVNHALKAGPPLKASSSLTTPAASTAESIKASIRAAHIVAPPKKPKVAPLMAKTLKFMKQSYRR